METTKRVTSSTSLLKTRVSGILEIHSMTSNEQEEELREALKSPLAGISRQRLRAMQINFRRSGTIDNCITSKELVNIFNEHNIGMQSRIFQMLVSKFHEGAGVNHERLWKFMVEAQSRTGRDSVQAIHKTQNHPMGELNEELSSTDRLLLEKVHRVLKASKDYDLEDMRTSCEDKDPSRNGQIPKKKLKLIVEAQRIPLSGALLTSLMKRCDEEKNGNVNWFEFMSLLEKAENLNVTHSVPTTTTPVPVRSSEIKSKQTKSTKVSTNTKPPPKPKVKQPINNNNTKRISNDEKGKSTTPEQGGKGQRASMDSGNDLSRKVTFRSRESSPSSSCNSSRRESLVSAAGDTDFSKVQSGNTVQTSTRSGSAGARQQSPRSGSTGTRQQSPRSGSNSTQQQSPRSGSTGTRQQSPQPGSTGSKQPLPRSSSATTTGRHSPRPGQGDQSNRKSSINSQSGKGTTVKKSPSQAKKSIKQSSKDQKIPHSMSMQNMASLKEVSETKEDMPHSESSPNLMNVSSQDQYKQGAAKKEQGISRIESTNSLTSTSSYSSADSQVPDKTPLLRGNIEGSKNWGKHVSIMNSFKSFLTRRKSSDKLAESKPQEPVKVEMVVRERLMTVYVPDKYVGNNIKCDEPKDSLQLDWIYGYRGNDCRNNLHLLLSGDILYFISCVAIIYNLKQHKQYYYKEHTGDIRSMAVHPDQVTIATGQSDLDGNDKKVKPYIRIWSSVTLQTIHVIEDSRFQQAIICLAFSKDLIAAVDNYETHTMSLWDVKTFKKVAETKCNAEVVCQVGFHPKNMNCIVSIGKEHLVFWELKNGSLQENMQADYKENAKAKFTICMIFLANGDLVTGDSKGTVVIWPNGTNTIGLVINTAHECPVFSLLEHKNSLLTGGRDGSICAWNFKEGHTHMTSNLLIPTAAGGVRTLQSTDQFLYIGTTLNCILGSELPAAGPVLSGATITKKSITQGHYDEVHGLGMFPNQIRPGVFITAGYDGMVCCYDSNTHHALWKHWIKDSNIQCLDIHPSGSILVLGAKISDIGSSLCFFTINMDGNLVELNKTKVSKSMITCVKFSPDGELLAAGCHDGRITTLKLGDGGKKYEVIGKCNIHQSSISGIDWSQVKCHQDNFILQSSSSTQEYFNFSATCELISNVSENRNVHWTTHSCMMGYCTNGLWGGDSDDTELNSVTRSHDQTLVVSGDGFGNVKMYTYPCCRQDAACKSYRCHMYGVNAVEFTHTDTHLLSVGNKDCAVIQWSLMR